MSANRRSFLRHFAALPIMSGAGIAASCAASTTESPSPEERMAFHLAEYKKAAEEIDPTINCWEGGAVNFDGHSKSTALTLYARRYAAWELKALNGGDPVEIDRLRADAGLEPFDVRAAQNGAYRPKII